MLGKTEGKKGRGQQRMRWLDGIADSMGMNLSKFREGQRGKDREAGRAAVHGVAKGQTRLSHRTTEPSRETDHCDHPKGAVKVRRSGCQVHLHCQPSLPALTLFILEIRNSVPIQNELPTSLSFQPPISILCL